MIKAGRWAFAALMLCAPAAADTLRLEAGGRVLLERPAAEWCLHWRHSVTGGPVADCFASRGGQMILDRSYLHDFAAGLGHIPGRGVQRAAEGGGYWIDAIGEAIPGNALVLRVGPARVGHLLDIGGDRINLSALAPDQRVRLRLLPGPPEQSLGLQEGRDEDG